MAIASSSVYAATFIGDQAYQFDATGPTNAASPASNEPVALASGVNTIAIPSGAVEVAIQMPSGNTTLVTFRGVSGDTGWGMLTGVLVLPIPAGSPTSFVLNAAAAVTVRIVFR
jgi:hypothetical protein